jgi:lantibiotic biosynthesis protein
MSIALKAGIQVSGQIEAMKTIIQWLKSKITTYQEAQFFRARVTFEEEINKLPPSSKSLVNREAWCYGTPGVARTLYLAGKALNDPDTTVFGAKAFLTWLAPHFATELQGCF